MTKNAIIFDFDGTIAETIPLALEALRRACARKGLRVPSDEEFFKMFGPTEHGVVKILCPENSEELFAMYLEEYKKLHQDISPMPFKGMVELLKKLHARGVKLAIITGKSDETLEVSLTHYGIAQYFDLAFTGGFNGSIKPECIAKVLEAWNMKPEDVLYVGDAITDVFDSRKAGVLPITARWSRLSPTMEELKDAKQDLYFNTIQELSDWLDA